MRELSDGEEIVKESGVAIGKCLLCGICSSGCPASRYMDYKPHQIAYLIRLGMIERVLKSRALDVCLTCFLCEERCPKGVRVTQLYIYLNNLRRRIYGFDKRSRAIIEMIKRDGRLDEVRLVSSEWGISKMIRTVLRSPKLMRFGFLRAEAFKVDTDKIIELYKEVGGSG
jgi:heterodisulfide reductase subunit C